MRRAFHLTAIALVLSLPLGACGEKGTGTTTTVSPSPSSSTPPPSSSQPSQTSTTTGSQPSSTSDVSVPASSQVVHLTAIRSASQPGGDRLTFEFDGATAPGYNIGYANGPVSAGESGKTLPVNGSYVLLARFVLASGVDMSGGGLKQTYTGPARFTPDGTQTISEIVRSEDFEGHLSWAIGMKAKAPFSVSKLSNPTRVVLDFAK